MSNQFSHRKRAASKPKVCKSKHKLDRSVPIPVGPGTLTWLPTPQETVPNDQLFGELQIINPDVPVGDPVHISYSPNPLNVGPTGTLPNKHVQDDSVVTTATETAGEEGTHVITATAKWSDGSVAHATVVYTFRFV